MLLDLLKQIHRAHDARRLFEFLGYTPDTVPLDDGTWQVARWRSFRVIAADAPVPGDIARALAQRLAGASERALVVAAGQNVIALAAPALRVPGSTRVLLIHCSEPTPFAIQQLERLRPSPGSTGLAHALRIAELLSSEAVGERFFSAFHGALERMADALGSSGTMADRRMAALLTLSRVLFLYFVQTKGWLDGQPDYLRVLFDQAVSRRRHFHRTALHPLFFGTLNRDAARRSAGAVPGRIPYLNGGLFEPHPAERRLGPVVFSNALWRDTFDGLFERFRFCVREADEVDAVAPDMLGRVFERVMDEEARRLSGTFYTPEAVVRQVVDATLETALAAMDGVGAEAAHQIMAGSLDRPASASLAGAVRGIRLLDPAAGSGAFLLGALDSLTRARLTVTSKVIDPRTYRWQVKREVLRENLFGVDLSPVAVRLAELRLWLAVVADDPTTDIAKVVPLPNLDGVVRQGDTLLDPIGAARSFGFSVTGNSESAAAVRSARIALFHARGNAHRQTATELRIAERQIAATLLATARAAVQRRLDDLGQAAASRDLFGDALGLSGSQRSRRMALKDHLAGIDTSLTALAEGEVPFFAFEIHAPDVITTGGFTAVVGNPPWVRAERLTAPRRRALKQRFKWWNATPDSHRVGYAHQPDLSIAFMERALELTAPNGAVGFLVPSKILSAGYGETARRRLVAETRIAYVHRVPDREAAQFGATTYPVALVVQRASPSRASRVRLGFDQSDSVCQQTLAQPGPWILVPDRQRQALAEYCASGEPLGRLARPALGVKTGADDVFIGVPSGFAATTTLLRVAGHDVNLERSMLRPALRGRDISPFRAQPRSFLIWTHDDDGTPRDVLPPLTAQYFGRHAARLRARSDYRAGPLWTLYRVRAGLAPFRVAWADIARRAEAVAVDALVPEAIPLNTCYVAAAHNLEQALVIAAVMNSTWTAALVTVSADEARGGYRRINAGVAAQTPIPPPGRRFDALAALSLDAHRHHAIQQSSLDDAVADALGLTSSVQDRLRSMAARHG